MCQQWNDEMLLYLQIYKFSKYFLKPLSVYSYLFRIYSYFQKQLKLIVCKNIHNIKGARNVYEKNKLGKKLNQHFISTFIESNSKMFLKKKN